MYSCDKRCTMADLDLNRAEDLMKEKYLKVVRNMSHLELKQFSKADYKKKVTRDMVQLLPNHDTAVLSDYAQCVSNALSREVQFLLSKRTRTSNIAETPTSPIISNTFINELETTMETDNTVNNQTPFTQTVVVDDDYSDSGDYSDNNSDKSDNECDICDSIEAGENSYCDQSQNCDDDATDCLNDSVTHLKQAYSAASCQLQNNEATDVTQSSQPTKKNTVQNKSSKNKLSDQKCCDTCAVKPKSKKKLDQIQCSSCMSWFHEQCMGLSKTEPVGVWSCLSCRVFPATVTSELSHLKSDINDLKKSTSCILTAVHDLTSMMERSIENINDRITALNRHMSTNDKSLTGVLETLSTTTNTIKSNLDQKSCQILNKTSAVLDKVKTSKSEKPKQNVTTEVRDLISVSSETTRNKQPTKLTQSHKTPQTAGNSRPKQTERVNKIHEKQTSRNLTVPKQKQSRPIVDVDLTQSHQPTKTIKQSTLLVGSSILKNVKTNELNRNTTVRSFPGATIETLDSKLSGFDLKQCETIVLHVGGNDADNGTDIETFAEQYGSLLTELMSNDRRIIVSGLLPRKTVDLSPYNDRLKSLCDAYEIDYIDNYGDFLLASGDIPDSYFMRDKIHLNSYGLKKLLSNINRVHHITGSRQTSLVNRRFDQSQSQSGSRRVHVGGARNYRTRTYSQERQSRKRYCHICQRDGHETRECWFNGRSSGRQERYYP